MVESDVVGELEVDLSVVIPTFNRCERLGRVLERLAAQHLSSGGASFTFEVIVVADGCSDGTEAMLVECDPPFPLVIRSQPNAGPAAARNVGIALAQADVIVFIDDDVMPEPGCLAAHIAHHRAADDVVVIGPMLTPQDIEQTPWVRWEQHQLEKQYRRFEKQPIAHARQFYTGNASARTRALRSVGGFDTSFRRNEDVELAFRLRDADQSFVFEPGAEAYHHADRSFESWYAMAYEYGVNDVAMGRSRRPEVLDLIGLFHSRRHVLQRLLVRWVLPRPRLAEACRHWFRRFAGVAYRVRAEVIGRQLLSAVYGLNYYQGMDGELGEDISLQRLFVDGRSIDRFVVWLVLEQTLGHTTHAANLREMIPAVDGVEPVFLPVSESLDGLATRVPGWSNWTIRAGLRARRALARAHRNRSVPRPDALFVHSQVPAVLLGRWMRRYPTVVSLDATPKQYDELGEHYEHAVGNHRVEALKFELNRRCFERARRLITWSAWARDSLVEGYGVEASKVAVISPGVDPGRWSPPDAGHDEPGPVRILFVGGDLVRKGGDVLLAAVRRMRLDPDVDAFELHVVSNDPRAQAEDGVFVYRGLTANSDELVAQYHCADIFCLPTYGDCLPMVLAEAGAAALPLVSTDVGAIATLVRHDETGRLVAAGDVDGLVAELGALVADGQLRRRLGGAARALVESDHDASKNASAIVEQLQRAALE